MDDKINKKIGKQDLTVEMLIELNKMFDNLDKCVSCKEAKRDITVLVPGTAIIGYCKECYKGGEP